VVKHVTEALNATVTFENAEEKGAKFIICLPKQQSNNLSEARKLEQSYLPSIWSLIEVRCRNQ
jgi:hypothetical protein